MVRYSDELLEEIKSKNDIVDIVSEYVNLKRSGRNFFGLCPFHKEKSPSFSVSADKQIFHCFGCNIGGDVFRFISKIENVNFREAVELLANRANVELPILENTGDDKLLKLKNAVYKVNEAAAVFYHENLYKPLAKPAQEYVKKRHLDNKTLKTFLIGYSGKFDELYKHLKEQGFSDEEILASNLVNRNPDGKYIDRFRNRLMFPILDVRNKVIAFGGRVLDDSKPKYINSPENIVYSKGRNLYAMNIVKNERPKTIIMVEGYMDLISLYQAGIKNVAASLGTALTDNQARLICRYSKNIVLAYDSDQAGINAALRGISVIQGAGGKARVMNVTDGKDPDDFVKKHGKDAFLKLADNATAATDYRIRLAAKDFDLSDDRQVLDFIDRVVPILRSLGPVEQDMYIRKLSEKVGISEHAISLAVNSDNTRAKTSRPSRPLNINRRDYKQENSLLERLEIALLLLASTDYRYLNRLSEDGIIIRTALADKVRSAEESLVNKIKPGALGIDLNEISELLDPDDEAAFRKYLNSIKIGHDDEAFYKQTKAAYFINNYRVEKTELQSELAVAEKLGNTEEVERIATALIELDKKINRLTEDVNG